MFTLLGEGGAMGRKPIISKKITCSEADKSLLSTIEASDPPCVYGTKLFGRNAAIHTRVVIVDGLYATAEVQLHVLLNQPSVERTQVSTLVVHTANERIPFQSFAKAGGRTKMDERSGQHGVRFPPLPHLKFVILC